MTTSLVHPQGCQCEKGVAEKSGEVTVSFRPPVVSPQILHADGKQSLRREKK